MQGLLRVLNRGFSKKLGIAETAKVIQEKIMNITQVVHPYTRRMMSRSSELWLALVMVSPEWSDLTRSRPEKWWSSDQESEVWLSISKLTMSVSSSSETIGKLPLIQIDPGRRHCYQNRCHRRCPYRRGNVRSSLRCSRQPYRRIGTSQDYQEKESWNQSSRNYS